MLQVCLINDPRVGHDYYKLYTVQYLGNRIEGYPVRYINVPIVVLKKAATESIKSKEVQDGGYNAEVYNDVYTVCVCVCVHARVCYMCVHAFVCMPFWLCAWVHVCRP